MKSVEPRSLPTEAGARRITKMSNNQTNSVSSVPSVAKNSVAKSWHHRMARLIADAYSPKCEAARCQRAAGYICEWDQMRGVRAVSGSKLYCAHHACNFAAKHNIYMADLPDVRLSQLETASRDDWRYSDELKPQMNADERRNNSVSSVSSVAKEIHHEGHEETRSINSVSSVLSVAEKNQEEV
jgi:hypothetical protein